MCIKNAQKKNFIFLQYNPAGGTWCQIFMHSEIKFDMIIMSTYCSRLARMMCRLPTIRITDFYDNLTKRRRFSSSTQITQP